MPDLFISAKKSGILLKKFISNAFHSYLRRANRLFGDFGLVGGNGGGGGVSKSLTESPKNIVETLF